ncbi:MAG TPA: hypothetical protein VI199_13465, partial [Novosphingobium sp.]
MFGRLIQKQFQEGTMKLELMSSAALVICASTSAQAAEDQAPGIGADIIVTGTRQTGMRAQDSAAPVQVVGVQALQNVGPPDLGPALSQALPSLNFQGFGNDTANLTLSAALRGISPN